MKDSIINILYGNILITIIRIFLGLLFLYSGFFKIIDLENFSRIMFLYDIAPDILVPYGTIFFAFLEFILGFLLLTGYKIKAASLISIVLMILFIIFIAINIYRGNSFDCGCFELRRFGINEEIGFSVIFRDLIFIILLFLVIRAKRHVFSIEKLIDEKRFRNI